METIEILSKELKLSFIRTNYQDLITRAKQRGDDFESLLKQLLLEERNHRRNNGIKQRMRAARFPQKKYLEDFKTTRFSNDIL